MPNKLKALMYCYSISFLVWVIITIIVLTGLNNIFESNLRIFLIFILSISSNFIFHSLKESLCALYTNRKKLMVLLSYVSLLFGALIGCLTYHKFLF